MTIGELTEKQRTYFNSGATRDYRFRLQALTKLEKAVNDYRAELRDALKADLNKHAAEGYMTETGLVLAEIREQKRHLRRRMKERRVRTPMTLFPARSFISPEPYGVVLIMAPWNYPVNLNLIPLVGAIAAGNCAIVKPSAYAPECSRVLNRLISNTFRPEYISVVEGGRDANTELLEQKFDYIFFTGSPAVGKTVMAAAAKNLTPVTLELGGKSPAIVDRSANLKLAAKNIAFGKTVNAGQTCVEPDYLLIDETVRDEFYSYYREALNGFFPDGDMSSMVTIINEKHYRRLLELLEGQAAVIGGHSDDERRFIEPTVLTEVDPSSPIMQQEIFGPILPVITFRDISECIDFIRARPRPLALYLFSEEKDIIRRVLDSCSFGGGCINDTLVHLSTNRLPFGGVGNSGMGAYHGKRSFDTFSHERGIVHSSGKFALPIKYMPYKRWKSALVRMFLK